MNTPSPALPTKSLCIGLSYFQFQKRGQLSGGVLYDGEGGTVICHSPPSPTAAFTPNSQASGPAGAPHPQPTVPIPRPC